MHRWRHKTLKKPLYSAMRKYGFDSFSISILGEYETREEGLLAEISWIETFKNAGAKLYNVTNGGEAGCPRDQTVFRQYYFEYVVGYDNSPPYEDDEEEWI